MCCLSQKRLIIYCIGFLFLYKSWLLCPCFMCRAMHTETQDWLHIENTDGHKDNIARSIWITRLNKDSSAQCDYLLECTDMNTHTTAVVNTHAHTVKCRSTQSQTHTHSTKAWTAAALLAPSKPQGPSVLLEGPVKLTLKLRDHLSSGVIQELSQTRHLIKQGTH